MPGSLPYLNFIPRFYSPTVSSPAIDAVMTTFSRQSPALRGSRKKPKYYVAGAVLPLPIPASCVTSSGNSSLIILGRSWTLEVSIRRPTWAYPSGIHLLERYPASDYWCPKRHQALQHKSAVKVFCRYLFPWVTLFFFYRYIVCLYCMASKALGTAGWGWHVYGQLDTTVVDLS